MRPLSLVIVFVALICGMFVPAIQAQDAPGMALVHAQLLAEAFGELEQQNGQMQESWALVDAGNASVLDAQRKGASLDSLRAQEDHLLELEALLMMRIVEVQRARRNVLTHRAALQAAGGATARRTEGAGALTGRWDLTVHPGLSGTAYLVQQGTLISGTYELSGGWTGSLRGTLVANKIRLERIDSQLGFAAIFYGEVNLGADPDVIQGRWEATQLATGMPSAGGWRASRED